MEENQPIVVHGPDEVVEGQSHELTAKSRMQGRYKTLAEQVSQKRGITLAEAYEQLAEAAGALSKSASVGRVSAEELRDIASPIVKASRRGRRFLKDTGPTSRRERYSQSGVQHKF